MRHVYRIILHDGTVKQVYGKKGLVDELDKLRRNEVEIIKHYKANGFWGDVTKLYLPEMR